MKRKIYGLEGLIEALTDLRQECYDKNKECLELADGDKTNYMYGMAEAYCHIFKTLEKYDIYDPNGEIKHLFIGKERI